MILKRLRSALAFFAPAPYNPTLVFLFFLSYYISRFLPNVTAAEIGYPRWRVALASLAIAVLLSGTFAGVTILFTRYRRWSSNNFFSYYIEISAGLALVGYLRSIVRPLAEKNFGLSFGFDITSSPVLFFWATVITLFVFSLMHRAERTIVGRLARADNLVEKLESDRRELVRADEQTRKQMTKFLHDRVQSELMVLAMRIETVGDRLEGENSLELRQITSRLEKIRRTDLKLVGQVLSPNIEGMGLETAIVELSLQLDSGIDFDIDVEDNLVNHDEQLALGVYRIVEQAFVNAITHGPAKKVVVKLSRVSDDTIQISVSDDGPGADVTKTVSGVGTAVIDSWVSILGGTKTVESSPGKGYRLSVLVPGSTVS